MHKELLSYESNHTWDLVPHQAATSVIGRKWIYSIRFESDGSLDRYKARLISQGFK